MKKRTIKKKLTSLNRGLKIKTGSQLQSMCEAILHNLVNLTEKQRRDYLLILLKYGDLFRNWAMSWMSRNWNDDYKEIIQELWDKYQEDKLGFIILRNFSEVDLRRNKESLTSGHSNYYTCKLLRRKMQSLDFVGYSEIDCHRQLGKYDMFVNNKLALDILYWEVEEVCKNLGAQHVIPEDEHIDVISMMNFPEIMKIKGYLTALGFKDVMDTFDDWNRKIIREIRASNEYRALCNEDIDEHSYRVKAAGMCLATSYIHLSDKYKIFEELSIEEMRTPEIWQRSVYDDDDLPF
ncbi:MAG: hypothetical protein IJ767_00185 [Bacteroidaceae bacterium]|nr:hypothetical protein [Bacteroidaceae bacterium]MBR1799903.1 hypothetical protein [Bacteroidaceae bacterium]